MTGVMLLAGLLTGLTLAGQQPAPQAIPAPPPDPVVWWAPEIPKPPPEQDPFQGRRLRKGEQLVPIDNGVDPLLYRLWGLQPLQSQLIKPGGLVLEVWARPATCAGPATTPRSARSPPPWRRRCRRPRDATPGSTRCSRAAATSRASSGLTTR
jgi:hypothetical protein